MLFTLFVVPGLLAPADVGDTLLGASGIVAATVRNVAFALLLLYLTDIQGERAAIVGTSHRWIPIALMIAVVLLVLSVVTSSIAAVFTERTPSVFTPVATQDRGPVGWALIVALMLSVAWVEELFFRGYILLRLRQLGASATAAIGLSALLFAVGHGYQGAAALAFSFAVGGFLGILWIRRPTILGFVVGHGVYNTAALLLLSL